MHTIFVGRGRGGRIRNRLRGTPPDLVAASSSRARYPTNPAMSPLIRSCGPVCGTLSTREETSKTASPLSTPSLKSSKNRSFTGPSPWLLDGPEDAATCVTRQAALHMGCCQGEGCAGADHPQEALT